jgi:hypothetical protein
MRCQPLSTIFSLLVATAFLVPSSWAQGRPQYVPEWRLEREIDLTALFAAQSITGNSIEYLEGRDSLLVGVESSTGDFAEISSAGALLATFDLSPPVSGFNLDNGGLSWSRRAA